MKSNASEHVAYSYLRFSSAEQAEGDSIRRQLESTRAWAKENGVRLDESLRDEGVSAFSGKHRIDADRHALAAFLDLVKTGRVARGSFLVVESLDRLSREHIRPALALLLGLIDQGIRVVQLRPTTMVYDERVEPMALMMAIMELSRGHSESQMKSERVGAKWAQRKKAASESGAIVTARCPAWLTVSRGKFEFKDAAREVIARIFAMCRDGLGGRSIAKTLNDEGVLNFIGKKWDEAYVRKIIVGRAVVGEYQPRMGKRLNRAPDGPAIANYFPAAITEDEWLAAQVAIKSRLNRGSRPAKEFTNPFAGLLRDAKTGGPIYLAGRVDRGRHYRVLVPGHSRRGHGGVCVSFPYETFEREVLLRLREIDPRDVLPVQASKKVSASVDVRLRGVEGRIEKIKARLVAGEQLDSLIDVLRTLEGERKQLAADLAAEQRESASPISSAWEKAHSLLDVIDKPDARLRLRSAIQRMVSGIWCVFVPVGRTQLAAVQIWFAGEKSQRLYVIMHKPAPGGPHKSGNAQSSSRSFTEIHSAGTFDLRQPGAAAELDAVLKLAEK